MSDAVLVFRSGPASSGAESRWRMALALAGLAAALTLLLLAGRALVWSRPAATTGLDPVPAGRPEWIEVLRPSRVYKLDIPLLEGLASTYSVRRRPADAEREDLMVFGEPGFDAPAVRLRIRRTSEGASPKPPLFAALVREASEAGFAVERAGLPDLMPSRFGPVELVDLSLGRESTPHVPCAGFRLVLETPALTIGGLACGALGRPLERAALSCLIDHLDVVADGADATLIKTFGAAESRRDPACKGTRPVPDVHRTVRPDDKPVTHARTPHRR